MNFVMGMIIVVFSTISFIMTYSINSFELFGQEPSIKMDRPALEKLIGEYGNWSANIPREERPSEGVDGSSCVIKRGSVNFLLDPYAKVKVFQTCDINSGSQLLYPFLYGWADDGSAGNENMSISQLTEQAFDANIGKVTMKAFFDGNLITDVEVKNLGQNNIKTVNKLPQNNNYKEILTHDLFTFTKDSNTEYACPNIDGPTKCRAIALCFCGILDNVTPGNHTLQYKTKIEGLPEFQGVEAHDDEINYAFIVH